MGEGKGKEDNPCTNAHRWQRAGVSGPARRSVVIQLSQVKSQTLGEGESEGAKCGAQEQPRVGFTSKPCLLSSQGLGGSQGTRGVGGGEGGRSEASKREGTQVKRSRRATGAHKTEGRWPEALEACLLQAQSARFW